MKKGLTWKIYLNNENINKYIKFIKSEMPRYFFIIFLKQDLFFKEIILYII
jgi:hypothetical protein